MNNPFPLLGITGYSGSGKTTLLEKLLPQLIKKGLRVSVIKHSHHNAHVDKEGKDILIGFNPRFLIDALKVIDDETISIYLVNPKAPCFIRDDEENYTYLILPVNINQNQAR